jgi:hypothetical protein
MAKSVDPKTCDLSFLKGSVYKDLRELGGNAYRDIKISLLFKTSSDLIYYLKKHSKLLKNFNGDEIVSPIIKGIFSDVYLVSNHGKEQVVVKRSHDGLVPVQLFRNFHILVPRALAKIITQDYDITQESLRKDVHEYEKIIKPFWGGKREKITGKNFEEFINMGLHMVDKFLPDFGVKDIYSKKFWKKMLKRKKHKLLPNLRKYLRQVPAQKSLIPEEERYVMYDSFTNSLQTYIIQKAVLGKEDIIPGMKMAYPFELLANGVIPKEMPKLMMEHLLRTIESFVEQLDDKDQNQKVPDFRPIESWKVFPPTPCEMYFAETGNLVVSRQSSKSIGVYLVDTHYLLDPEFFLLYKWVEKRYWESLFLNLRFWIKKALDYVE